MFLNFQYPRISGSFKIAIHVVSYELHKSVGLTQFTSKFDITKEMVHPYRFKVI